MLRQTNAAHSLPPRELIKTETVNVRLNQLAIIRSLLKLPRKIPYEIALIALAAPALVSLLIGILQASNVHVFRASVGSLDLQWSCTRLIAMRRDPWKTFLMGDPERLIILGQQPNYLPELYILLLPLGLVSFHTAALLWAGISVALSIAILWLTIKIFELSRIQALICADVFLASTPLRVALANGQQITLIFAFLAAAFYCKKRPIKGLWLGLSYCKYSFAPIIVLTWLFDRRYLVLFYSLIAPVLGLIAVYCLIGSSSLIGLILGPIRTAEITFKGSYGFADVMSLAKLLVDRSHTNNPILLQVPNLSALVASCGAALYLHRRRLGNESIRAALMMTLTLLVLRHLTYDFIILLLPFAAAFGSKALSIRVGIFTIIAYFWFGSSIVNRFVHEPSALIISANCLALLILTWLITHCDVSESAAISDPNAYSALPSHELRFHARS
jgi:hypothetical protein